jgi:ATP-dependent DNA helicase RecG
VLNQIISNPKITRKELAEMLGINISAIQKHIKKLKQTGAIKREGGDFGGKWIVLTRFSFT